MTKKKIDLDPPFFDDEERRLIQEAEAALDHGDVKPVSAERKAELEATARATMNPKKKPITTRLAERDLQRLKIKAMEKGIPYQTLLASIIHQYVEGHLIEKP